VVFDWEHNQVNWQMAVDSPTGFCWRDDLLYLNMLRTGEIVAVDGYGHEQRRISHRLFNDLHTILPSRRGFLLTSSGIDSIVEIDPQGNLLYEWCALDHGYDRCPNGQQRLLDRELDHRYVLYDTMRHTTHVNSARFADESEETVLATLFHQGTVIAIDRASGEARTLLDGLDCPHDLRPYPASPGSWLLSNTQQNETLILGEDWEILERIKYDFQWVNSTIALEDGSLVIADVNNYRLVRVFVQERRPPELRAFPPEWHIYAMEEVTENQLTFFPGGFATG